MVFIAYPIIRIVLQPPEPVTAVLALSATALFAFLIASLARRPPEDPRRASPSMAVSVVGIIALAAATTVRSSETGWVVLFYFGSTGASLIIPERRALALIITAGTATAIALTGTEEVVGAVIQGVAVSVIGITVFALSAARRANTSLEAARQDLARLAVARERDRIARDLHDTLGHSLSLIAIKSELAGRLLPRDPERAAAEIADVEHAAREALASVRAAVRGDLRPTLIGELDAARAVLDAAGVEVRIDHDAGPLPTVADGVLAWAVREGVTNVVRHSGARRGEIRTWRTGAEVDLEVRDDGRHGGAPSSTVSSAGSGLRGVRERAMSIGGRVEAGPLDGRGYRLFVAVPVGDAPAGAEGSGVAG
jgi:two-component system sensor histidine kinase DesK